MTTRPIWKVNFNDKYIQIRMPTYYFHVQMVYLILSIRQSIVLIERSLPEFCPSVTWPLSQDMVHQSWHVQIFFLRLWCQNDPLDLLINFHYGTPDIKSLPWPPVDVKGQLSWKFSLFHLLAYALHWLVPTALELFRLHGLLWHTLIAPAALVLLHIST